MNNATTIDLPTADDLDTGRVSEPSGYRVDLYLVPAAETENGVPAVEIHSGVGNIGSPAPAFHGRWRYLGSYGAKVVGESVLEQLVEASESLLALAHDYRGSEWDGHNHRGCWSDDDDLGGEPEDVVDLSDVRCYWDAFEWFGPADVSWAELCEAAGVDAERVLSDDWEDVAREVAAIVEPQEDQAVSGTEDYALQMAENYRALGA